MSTGYRAALNRGVSHVTATPVANLGDKIVEAGNEYAYVYVKTGVTALQGYAVHLSSSTGFTVTMSGASDGDKQAFGVVKHNDIPVGEYGWVLTRGFVDCTAGNNTGLAEGDQIIMVSTTNTGNIARKTVSTGNIVPAFGQCLQVAATGADGACYIYGAGG